MGNIEIHAGVNETALIPIGEAFGGLSDPVKALTKTSPQALHHFTQADQVNQLVTAREEDPDLGFMARLMALCSLPRTNPGNRLQYKRVNGPYKLVMIAGADNKLPYGNLPRLLIAWVCTDGRAHTVPRVDPGFFAVRVHGQAGYGLRRRRSDPPPQSDEAGL